MEVDHLNVTISYHVYEYRISRGLTVRGLSNLSGISKTQINGIENGKVHPSVYVLCCLAVALDVQPQDLFSYSVCP